MMSLTTWHYTETGVDTIFRLEHHWGVKPIKGMVTIAEYPSRWEANVAAARLRDAGLESTVLVDPATDVAPHHVTDRMAVLVVREEAAEPAAAILDPIRSDREAERLDAAYHQHRFSDRPAWIRYATWALIIAIPGPLALSALWVLWYGVRGLFP